MTDKKRKLPSHKSRTPEEIAASELARKEKERARNKAARARRSAKSAPAAPATRDANGCSSCTTADKLRNRLLPHEIRPEYLEEINGQYFCHVHHKRYRLTPLIESRPGSARAYDLSGYAVDHD